MGLLTFWKKDASIKAVPVVPDVWERNKGYLYVADLKERYDEIVKKLFKPERNMTVELDTERACAWFRSNGWTVARVIVHGEVGMPSTAIVYTFLSEDEQLVFRKTLQLSRVSVRFEGPDW